MTRLNLLKSMLIGVLSPKLIIDALGKVPDYPKPEFRVMANGPIPEWAKQYVTCNMASPFTELRMTDERLARLRRDLLIKMKKPDGRMIDLDALDNVQL